MATASFSVFLWNAPTKEVTVGPLPGNQSVRPPAVSGVNAG
jgi:hypothetical protein